MLLNSFDIRHHDGEWLVDTQFAVAQFSDRLDVRCIAGQVEAAEPLNGDDLAVGQSLTRFYNSAPRT